MYYAVLLVCLFIQAKENYKKHLDNGVGVTQKRQIVSIIRIYKIVKQLLQ